MAASGPGVAEVEPEDREHLALVESGDLPTPELMRHLGRSRGAWSRVVDPARGLVVVEYREDASGEDPRANHDGIIARGEHLCGVALEAELDRTQRELALRLEQRMPEEGPLFACEGLICSHRAMMEYDHGGEYVFVLNDGGPKLHQIVRIEGAGMTRAFEDAAKAFALAELARMEGMRCDGDANEANEPGAGP